MPPNTLVIIVIAAVVLISVFGFLGGQFFSSSSKADNQRLFARGCSLLQTGGCDITRIDDIKLDNTKFNSVCSENGYQNAAACARACGCTPVNYEDYDV